MRSRSSPHARPIASANRQHEPYRRAITGIYARLAATARVIDDLKAPQHAVSDAPPYRDSGELLADLSILDSSLVANGSGILAEGRLRGCAVPSMSSAFISPRSICGRTRRCTSARSAELLGLAQPGLDYAALAEPERIRLLLTELGTARPLASPFLAYSARDRERACDPARDRRSASPLRAERGAALRDFKDRPASPTFSKPLCC